LDVFGQKINNKTEEEPKHSKYKHKKVFKELVSKEKKIGVIGLGYVGLPLALEFAKYFKVVGFDINQARVDMMKNHIDPSKEMNSSVFEGKDIEFTTDLAVLRTANFLVVAVPTPVDEHRVPDLTPLLKASETVGKVVKKGDIVVFESTVYPGCTEEDCLPVVERVSGLTFGKDFFAGYSPERINPGEKERTIEKIIKVVSGSDAPTLETVAAVYGHIITAGVHKAPSIKVAEAAKVIENTQRDLNISLMNELSVIFDRMGIDTREVLEAAGTKWNFLKFYPGLVGGHCIGVDPYYLTYKSTQLGYVPEVILSGRRINDDMPAHIAKRLVQLLMAQGKNPAESKTLILGMTFKENVSDIRNSKVADLAREMMNFSLNVHLFDPHASANEVSHEYKLTMIDQISDNYDAVVVAVGHDEFKDFGVEYFKKITRGKKPILIDLKGLYPKSFGEELTYWRL
jgi:UDP-N-acetyl-D-glucosamine/UDP-N-acetyl-D-galactosamine dehydrogenase